MLPLVLLLVLGDAQANRPPRATAAAPPRDAFFSSTLPVSELRNKQAVLETSYGTIVLDLLPDAAPNHVAHFVTRARAGAYDGTTFHRVISMGIVQGGDPLSKDPAQAARYGTGGLGVLRFEANAEKHTRGAVSAVLVPGNRDSGGSQFFISVTDQPALDGQYTVFARVAEGIGVAQKISTSPANATVPAERIEIRKVTIREKPAPVPEPFLSATVEELAKQRAVLETSMGNITFEFFPDRAPMHVRTRREPLEERQQSYVRTLQPEFNATVHDRGIVSMARGADPASATSSFFIVLAPAPSLDRQYTAFGRVVDGMDVVAKLEGVALEGETPVARIEVNRVRVVRAD
jgi:cyclophilin family peptidyl-prolyl cis-trans isomerase